MLGEPNDHRPVVALDWSFHGIHVTFDGEQVEQLASVDALLADARLRDPHRIAAESTFESWDPQRRLHLIERLRAAGHELFVYRPLHTARARRALGSEKSDAEDARTIWKLAHHPRFRLYPAVSPDQHWASTAGAAQQEYTRIRLTGGKSALADTAAAVLGPLRERSEESQLVLGGSVRKDGYSETLLAVLWFVASKGFSRSEMERLVGLHGSGYPSLLRSEVHTHCARHALKKLAARAGVHRRRSVDDLGPSPLQDTSTEDSQGDWRIFRRELRRAYSELVASLRSGDEHAGTDAVRTEPHQPS